MSHLKDPSVILCEFLGVFLGDGTPQQLQQRSSTLQLLLDSEH